MKIIKNLLIVLCLCASCKKSAPDTDPSPVIGQWTWYKSTGGIANINITPQSTGLNWSLHFNSNSTCFQDGTFSPINNGPGTYTLMEIITPQNVVIRYINITSAGSIRQFRYSFITADTLQLDDKIEVDGLSNFFVRVK
jgi:hypothetical protein